MLKEREGCLSCAHSHIFKCVCTHVYMPYHTHTDTIYKYNPQHTFYKQIPIYLHTQHTCKHNIHITHYMPYTCTSSCMHNIPHMSKWNTHYTYNEYTSHIFHLNISDMPITHSVKAHMHTHAYHVYTYHIHASYYIHTSHIQLVYHIHGYHTADTHYEYTTHAYTYRTCHRYIDHIYHHGHRYIYHTYIYTISKLYMYIHTTHIDTQLPLLPSLLFWLFDKNF